MSFKGWGWAGGSHHLLWKSPLFVTQGVDVSISGKRENSESAEPCLLPTQQTYPTRCFVSLPNRCSRE